ncbi:MAG: helix-turn-helix domain-containing protein [Prevotellaceae bacterium]|jgi:transcriptional regulator with XRE-family HTH domain|nr:helix-turn-helix domain-containing protein [Prevotellaceae bacterium]
MNSRIQKFIEAEGLTAARFADAIGVQRSNVSHVLSGRNKPSFDFIEKMLRKFPEINAEWLIMGKGHMYKESHMPSLFNVPTIENTDTTNRVSNTPLTESKKNDPQPILAQDQAVIADRISLNAMQNGKRLARILLCYSDGSFEVFDSNANEQ